MYFLNRRPRGFRHTYRFSSEQRDIIDRLKRGDAPSDIAADTLRADCAQRGGRARSTSGGLLRIVMAVALLMGILAAAMAMMLFL